MSKVRLSERWIVALIGAVQFVNVLDFMMVMPLGPDFAAALLIPTSKLGWIGGSYTAAAAISGVIGSFFLDRFDRRSALFIALLGLAAGTFAGGGAVDFTTLLATRVIAGLFGGPATSLALSIVADAVPPARRGRAMGAVMGAFSLASVFGVPLGLELARLGGWRAPFFAVGGLCLLVTFLAIAKLPPMREHLAKGPAAPHRWGHELAAIRSLLCRPEVLYCYAAVACAMFGAFSIIPNISTWFQYNLGFPRERLGLLYLISGLISFGAMKIAGRVVDRWNAFAVGCVSAAVLTTILFFGFYSFPVYLPPVIIFIGFMTGMSIRGVAVASLASRVPRPSERARYMSIQSAVQHFASALGAFLASELLYTGSKGTLAGMPRVATIAIITALLIPFLFWKVEKNVRAIENFSK